MKKLLTLLLVFAIVLSTGALALGGRPNLSGEDFVEMTEAELTEYYGVALRPAKLPEGVVFRSLGSEAGQSGGIYRNDARGVYSDQNEVYFSDLGDTKSVKIKLVKVLPEPYYDFDKTEFFAGETLPGYPNGPFEIRGIRGNTVSFAEGKIGGDLYDMARFKYGEATIEVWTKNMSETECMDIAQSYFTSGRDTSMEAETVTKLAHLGLFKGVGEGKTDLDRVPTRIEALVMTIRLMGTEDEALASTWKHPFEDVPAWADRYVAYAYNTGLVKGISATEFGAAQTAGAAECLAFTLRALGIDTDAEGGWSEAAVFDAAKDAKILPEGVGARTFLRADLMTVCYAAYLKIYPDFKAFSLAELCAYYLQSDGAYAEGSGDELYRRFMDAPEAVLNHLALIGDQTVPRGQGVTESALAVLCRCIASADVFWHDATEEFTEILDVYKARYESGGVSEVLACLEKEYDAAMERYTNPAS